MSDQSVTAPSNSEPINIDGCAALYVELRDEVTRLKAELKEKLKPYHKGLADLDGILLKALQDQGAKSISTPSGTVYQRVERSATIRDKKAFREFVIGNQEFDLIDWRAGKVAVFDYMEKNSTDVPGLNTTSFMTIGVLRGVQQENDSDE